MKKKKDHLMVPIHECPKCGYSMDCVSSAFTDETPIPKAGDYTICLSCGTMLIFTDSNGGIRLPTFDEKVEMNKRYDITKLRIAWADIVGDKIKNQRERESGSDTPQ